MARKDNSESVVVIGLGRFGSAVAKSLTRLGHEVLAIDEREPVVQEFAGQLTHVVQANSTSVEALRQLSCGEFDHAVVAIGSDLEASVLTTLALVELGVRNIWAKAMTERHGRILQKTGAHHVVFPEADMGERLAHLVTGKMIDFIAFEDGFAIAKTRTPVHFDGKTFAQLDLRQKHGVTVVGLKRPHTDFVYAGPDTVIRSGDIMIVSGPTVQVEEFAALT